MKRRPRTARTFNDLAHEVFLRLFRDDAAAAADPQGYLDRAASEVRNEWRQHSRLRAVDGELPESLPQPPDLPRIRTVLDRLPQHRREILLLHVKEGLPYQQIAQRKRMSEEMVLDELVHAYSQLRMELHAEDLGDLADDDRA